MNLFKTFSLKWWQASTFKAGMLAAGIAIGSYWYEFFGTYLPVLIIVAAIGLEAIMRGDNFKKRIGILEQDADAKEFSYSVFGATHDVSTLSQYESSRHCGPYSR